MSLVTEGRTRLVFLGGGLSV